MPIVINTSDYDWSLPQLDDLEPPTYQFAPNPFQGGNPPPPPPRKRPIGTGYMPIFSNPGYVDTNSPARHIGNFFGAVGGAINQWFYDRGPRPDDPTSAWYRYRARDTRSNPANWRGANSSYGVGVQSPNASAGGSSGDPIRDRTLPTGSGTGTATSPSVNLSDIPRRFLLDMRMEGLTDAEIIDAAIAAGMVNDTAPANATDGASNEPAFWSGSEYGLLPTNTIVRNTSNNTGGGNTGGGNTGGGKAQIPFTPPVDPEAEKLKKRMRFAMEEIDTRLYPGWSDEFFKRMGRDPISWYSDKAFLHLQHDPERQAFAAANAAFRDGMNHAWQVEEWQRLHGNDAIPDEMWERWWKFNQNDRVQNYVQNTGVMPDGNPVVY